MVLPKTTRNRILSNLSYGVLGTFLVSGASLLLNEENPQTPLYMMKPLESDAAQATKLAAELGL